MDLIKKYYLGDGENYFIYRPDKYNKGTLRADLFNSKNEKIHTTLVKCGILQVNKTEFDVINEFEVFVM